MLHGDPAGVCLEQRMTRNTIPVNTLKTTLRTRMARSDQAQKDHCRLCVQCHGDETQWPASCPSTASVSHAAHTNAVGIAGKRRSTCTRCSLDRIIASSLTGGWSGHGIPTRTSGIPTTRLERAETRKQAVVQATRVLRSSR